jgi:hypothetical protein
VPDRLRREDNFGGDADSFYEALLRAHEGLSDAESAALDARLVLILANQVGDLAVLREALAAARASLAPSSL